MTLRKVVSGGQTGVDQAGLEAALRAGLSVGGWCPKGRLSEGGPIPARYPLRETPGSDYPQRTEWNVRDSDATLILHEGHLHGGTELTRILAERLDRLCLCVDLSLNPSSGAVIKWLKENHVVKLNVAGPRESGSPGIYSRAFRFLSTVFTELNHL